ncbi:SGNH/GDSL hydrolase family protein [Streptomyces sp. NPDC088354]|uniref:SGNH/GDSL hydrolase family protein n=1 Tax=unclassified Streptomyces TaxID=2593676 RepID=UPI0029B02E52|nr:SGNH/GDSL hydrolase family protein [Streptomyces sp. MI02-7b]MDX3072136.1 SGNH/GDSL hydrolase family protein [Streptomyces sp. MI02-7b]
MAVGRASILGVAAAAAALLLTAGSAVPAAAHGGAGHGHGHGPGHGHGHRDAYVALGDSYTSGPLIPTQVDVNCARSDRNYPSLVAGRLRGAVLTDVSCGGATTAEMWQAQGTNPPQLDALSRRTSLVTVQIGGNDVGFGSIIRTCAGAALGDPTGNPCQRYYSSGGSDQLRAAIDATAPKIDAVLDAVHRRAPHARVVVVGYPDLLPDSGVGCRPAVPFADGDFAYLRDTEKRLNAMLARRAKAARATYVDTYTPTVGHDMCTAPGVRWIEPLTPAAPAAPAHPNALGEKAMAAAVLDRLHVRG